MIIRFSSSLLLITLKISLPSLDISGKVKYQVRIYLIFLLKTNSGALHFKYYLYPVILILQLKSTILIAFAPSDLITTII